MQLDMKKLIRYAIMLTLGMSLMVYGVIDVTLSRYAPKPISDQEIIDRAKDLGMVSIKDKWIESQKEKENED